MSRRDVSNTSCVRPHAYHCTPVDAVEPAAQPYPAAVLQLVHDGAPAALYVPAGHIADAGVAVVDPAGHAYPAAHSEHDVAPEVL